MPDQPDQPTPQDPLAIGELISLAEATKHAGLSHSHLRITAEKGRLKAKKMGRDWFTTMAAIDEYLESRHRGKRTDLDK